jgi:hypothetical protein
MKKMKYNFGLENGKNHNASNPASLMKAINEMGKDGLVQAKQLGKRQKKHSRC